MTAMCTPVEIHYGFFASGTEAAAVIIGAEDNNQSINVDSDVEFHLRMSLEEQSAGDDSSSMADWTVVYEKNATGGDADVPTSDGGAGISTAAAGLSNGGTTTERLTSGTAAGAFMSTNVLQTTDGQATDFIMTGTDWMEIVYGLKFYAANVNDGDFFDFTYTVTNETKGSDTHGQIRITISKSAGGQLHLHHQNLNGLGIGGPFYINPIG